MSLVHQKSQLYLINTPELKDYLLYTDDNMSNDIISMYNRSQEDLLAQAVSVPELAIPTRSPNRKMQVYTAKYYDSIGSSPGTISDASFRKHRHARSSVSDDSIFSSDHRMDHDKHDSDFDYDLDLDLSDIEDILEEFELDDKGHSKIVFNIDSVVSIVGIHSPAPNAAAALAATPASAAATERKSPAPLIDRKRKTLSYIQC